MAQDALIRLEKASAPIREQIEQAALFAGTTKDQLDTQTKRLASLSDFSSEREDHVQVRRHGIHGREEWVLKWLMKKLSSSADARAEPLTWGLLFYLVESMPTRTAAKVLSERALVQCVRMCLEEAMPAVEDNQNGQVEAKETGKVPKSTKKRKRTAESVTESLVHKSGTAATQLPPLELLKSVHSVVENIVALSSSKFSGELEAEYMGSVIRVSSEEAARVIGIWLSLCKHHLDEIMATCSLEPFLRIWTARITSPEETTVFSKSCLLPVLELLGLPQIHLSLWESQLEKLVARNLIMPAKADYLTSKNTNLLNSLVHSAVLAVPLFAPKIFCVAIRCLQSPGNKPRKPAETAWLSALFAVMNDTLKETSSDLKGEAIERMLQYCVEYHVHLELGTLREILSLYVLGSDDSLTAFTNWTVMALILKLDANVLLIPETDVGGRDLYKSLLGRITHASHTPGWAASLVHKVVDDVVVPLMGEYAKARDLTGFVHQWYEQLVVFEALRQNRKHADAHLSAWEMEGLKAKLREVMEASLSTQQIVQIVDWLQNMPERCEGAAHVIADAMAGAIKNVETIDAVGLRLVLIVFHAPRPNAIASRYYPCRWRTARNTFSWKIPESESEQWQTAKETLLTSISGLQTASCFTIESYEAFKCVCTLKSGGMTGKDVDSSIQVFVPKIYQLLVDLQDNLISGGNLGSQLWGQDNVQCEWSNDFMACQLAECILVDYPCIIAGLETDRQTATQTPLLQVLVWIAAVETPYSAKNSPLPWIRLQGAVIPTFWLHTLSDDRYLNNPAIMIHIIDTLLECGVHLNNPIEPSRACNGFVIKSLLRLPIEVFSRSQRERILKMWQPESADPALKDHQAKAFRVATLNPAVLSLKTKMMQRPTLYEGIRFQELVDIGDNILLLTREPDLLPLFSELAKLTLGHIMATMEQPKSRAYLAEVIKSLHTWFKHNSEAKGVLSSPMISLVQVILATLAEKSKSLAALDILSEVKHTKLLESFHALLEANFQRLLRKPEKLKKDGGDQALSLLSTVNGLDMTGGSVELSILEQNISSIVEISTNVGQRLQSFLLEHGSKSTGSFKPCDFNSDLSINKGRENLRKRIRSATKSIDEGGEAERLQLAIGLMNEGLADKNSLYGLLALKHLIVTCDDSRDTTKESSETGLNISSIYLILAAKLCQADGFRQFCLISEIMELMLRSKGRSMTQFDIDTTLSSIAIVCSRSGPSLSPKRAGTIFLHLCHLLQVILLSHRLKLQGRFHLVVQVMQALLHCLFMPILSSASLRSSITFPPWLASSFPSNHVHISTTHATAYARLLTLICDPSVSTVSHASRNLNSLNSATAKAKRLAGQHMPVVLAAFIRLQLDMSLKMEPLVREKLTPGWYAIFDTMSMEGRRVLGESLDSQGRAVLGNLIRDWTRFGKWTGS